MINKTTYLPEDLDGQLGRDDSTKVLIKNLPEFASPCLGLDLGAGDTQQAISRSGVQLVSVNSLFHNHDAASQRSKSKWTEFAGDESFLPPGEFNSAVFRLSKNTERNLAIFRALWTKLKPGSQLFCYGPGDEGIKGFQHKLERMDLEVEIVAMGKGCRILGITVSGECPVPVSDLHFEYQGQKIPTPPGVFSAARLDGGTQLLLKHLPNLKGQKVVDLGCGCGIISLACLDKNAKQLWSSDVFGPAVRATQALLEGREGFAGAHWDFIGNSNQRAFKADFVITNPPFHQEKRLNHRIGMRWLEACERLLRDGGQVILVANKFLDYPGYAEGIFSQVEEIAVDSSFRVLRMVKLRPSANEELDQWTFQN